MVLCAFIALNSNVFAAEASNNDNQSICGRLLSTTEFNEIYCSADYSEKITLANLKIPANLIIKDISVSGTRVELSLEITMNGQLSSTVISGDLYASYKQQDGRNSIVGNMISSNPDYQVLLFEVFDDTANDTLLINPSLNNIPHMKLYLSAPNNMLLLFESKLPTQLRNLSFIKNEQIASTKDIFWFVGIVEPYEKKQLPTDREMRDFMGIEEKPATFSGSAPLASDLWTGQTYYCSFIVGSDYYQYWSMPYGNMSIPSTITSSDTTWTSSFKVAEHISVNGITYRDIDNLTRCASSTYGR